MRTIKLANSKPSKVSMMDHYLYLNYRTSSQHLFRDNCPFDFATTLSSPLDLCSMTYEVALVDSFIQFKPGTDRQTSGPIMITFSACRAQVVGNQQLPVLRMVDVTSGLQQVFSTYHSRVYVPVIPMVYNTVEVKAERWISSPSDGGINLFSTLDEVEDLVLLVHVRLSALHQLLSCV